MQYINNFTTALDADLPTGSLSMTLPLAEASKLSTASPASPFRITLSKNGDAQVEMVDVTAVSGVVCTVIRAVEGWNGNAASEFNWLIGDLVECNPTAAAIEAAGGTLGGLSDVNLAGAVEGDQLTFDFASGAWIPGPAGSGGGGGSGYGNLGAVQDLGGGYDSGTDTTSVPTNTNSVFTAEVADTLGTGCIVNLDLAAPGSGANLYKCTIIIYQGSWGGILDSCTIHIRDSFGYALNVVGNNGGPISVAIYENSDANGIVINLYTVSNGAHWYSDY